MQLLQKQRKTMRLNPGYALKGQDKIDHTQFQGIRQVVAHSSAAGKVNDFENWEMHASNLA